MITHYTDPYLINPVHKITVDLVGMGGTGSQVLSGLARMNSALIALGHAGLHVRAWDDDIVTEANLGRQLFSESDIGINKAIVLITRVNRYFGYEWEGIPEVFGSKAKSNIVITCVDSAKARLMIGHWILGGSEARAPQDKKIYWLDIGNLEKTGQVVLGTLRKIKQPTAAGTMATLPTVIKKYPELKKLVNKETDLGPSCSLAEALTRQDLYINSTLAQFGCNMLWKLFREGKITYHGCYVNLESFIVNPIKIPDGKRNMARKRPAHHRKGPAGNKRKTGKRNKKGIKRRVPVR